MSGKKVYDLAKEFGVQSKEFATMLQEINIPIKNHMSVMTEQQEKYFRNNFEVIDNKVVARSNADKKKAEDQPRSAQPQQRSQRPQQRNAQGDRSGQRYDQRPPRNPSDQNQGGYYDRNRQNYDSRPGGQNRDGRYGQNQQQGQGSRSNYYNRQNNGTDENRQRSYQQDGRPPRDNNRSYGQDNRPPRDPNRPYGQDNRPPRDGNRPYGQDNRPPRDPNRPYGQDNRPPRDPNRPYGQGGNRSGQPYQGNNPRGGGGNRPPYQQRDGRPSQPWGDKDKDAPSRPYGQSPRPPRKTGSGVEKPVEKSSKIEKTKKENKLKSEQKQKGKENFFKDEKPTRSLDNTKRTKGSKSSYKKKKLQEKEERQPTVSSITIPESITVADLAEKINVSPTEIIKILISYGTMANINQMIDFDTASIVCEEMNVSVKLEEEEDLIEKILQNHFKDPEKLKSRPPIITVMGHVDHGKTSLLDYIRNTNVISGEAGGITQHIGAYTITTHEKSITFIDTPGHEAFTAMRSRGASVTDIAVLVIAADDGIKPQTVEAINHAKAAEVPIIVAINKIDKPAANPDKVKQELTEYGLVPEDWGGNTICVNVSAKTGQGIDDLLDTILLVAEVEDLKANYEEPAVGTIIEARIDKQRGVTASVLVASGILHDGDIVVSGAMYAKVRAMTNDKGMRIETAGPSMAAELLGLNEVPEAGDKFFVAETEKEARKITEARKDRDRRRAMKANAPVTLDELFNQISQGELKELKVVLKADVSGSLEALKQSLEKLNDNEDSIRVNVIHDGVGAITETDVSLAAASNAIVIGFNVRADNNARAASAKEGVEIRYYTVIYNVLEEIEDAMKGMLEPEFREVITATAEIRQLFRLPNSNVVAGSYVTSGTITRKDKVRVLRDGIIAYDGTIASLKRIKDDVKEVASGYECGIVLEKFNDLKETDTLEFYKMEEIPRE